MCVRARVRACVCVCVCARALVFVLYLNLLECLMVSCSYVWMITLICCLLQLKELRPRMYELLTPFAVKAERLSQSLFVRAESLGEALNRRFNLSEKVRRDRSRPKNDD